MSLSPQYEKYRQEDAERARRSRLAQFTEGWVDMVHRSQESRDEFRHMQAAQALLHRRS